MKKSKRKITGRKIHLCYERLYKRWVTVLYLSMKWGDTKDKHRLNLLNKTIAIRTTFGMYHVKDIEYYEAK